MPLAIVVSETHRPLNPDIDITTFRFILDSISGEIVAENGKHIGSIQTRSKKKTRKLSAVPNLQLLHMRAKGQNSFSKQS
jgi:hypothetical protein